MAKRRTAAAVAVLSTLGVLVGGFAGGTAQASTGRRPIPGTRPSWASQAAEVGPVGAATTVNARVYLAGRDPAGMTAYARAVSDPTSPVFRHYLSPGQYRRQYGPTQQQVRAVTRWLTGAGLDITATTSHYVAVRGTVAAAEKAFGTRLETYRGPGGRQRAPRTEVNVPDPVAPSVLTVTGLATSPAQMTSDVVGGPEAVNVGTCSSYYGQKRAATLPPAYGRTLNYDLCGYTPAQLRSAYHAAHSGLTGKGVTIAIVDDGASPTILNDANTYSAQHGLPQFRPGQFTQNLPGDIGKCPPRRAYVEENLDVEAAHTMAPGAAITYVAAGCTKSYPIDALDAETRIVDGRLADIVSDSWHLGTEAEMTPDIVTGYQQVFEQGAIEGIGFYFSSGDHGDWTPFPPNTKPAVQYPGSDPWVTGVGGTSLAIDRHGRYMWETGWGALAAPLAADGKSWTGLPGTFDGAAGGGASALFGQPYYQRGIVPDSLSHSGAAGGPMRVMPDIAADGDDHTGMLVGLTATLTPNAPPQYVDVRVAGTSLATPLIAGLQADAQQAQHGIPIGFADPAIYRRYGTPAYHDVTDSPLGPKTTIADADIAVDPTNPAKAPVDSAVTFAHDTSLHATRGYDDITGVGTPDQGYLGSYRLP